MKVIESVSSAKAPQNVHQSRRKLPPKTPSNGWKKRVSLIGDGTAAANLNFPHNGGGLGQEQKQIRIHGRIRCRFNRHD